MKYDDKRQLESNLRSLQIDLDDLIVEKVKEKDVAYSLEQYSRLLLSHRKFLHWIECEDVKESHFTKETEFDTKTFNIEEIYPFNSKDFVIKDGKIERRDGKTTFGLSESNLDKVAKMEFKNDNAKLMKSKRSK